MKTFIRIITWPIILVVAILVYIVGVFLMAWELIDKKDFMEMVEPFAAMLTFRKPKGI